MEHLIISSIDSRNFFMSFYKNTTDTEVHFTAVKSQNVLCFRDFELEGN